jgi:hypothetical protein
MKTPLVALAAFSLLLSSCSIMAIKKHEPNFKSSREIAKSKGSYKIGAITTSGEELTKLLRASHFQCRMTTFNMPANKTVEDFLRDSFTDELDAAEKLSGTGTPISLEVKKMESSSGLDKGTWTLDFTYKVGSRLVEVNTVSEFESAFAADTACRNTASAFSDAVGENFVGLFRKLSGH